MVGFFVPAGFEPMTLTTQSGLTTHSVTDCSRPRGPFEVEYERHLFHELILGIRGVETSR